MPASPPNAFDPTRRQLPSRRPLSRDKADTLVLLAACTLVLAPHAVHLPLWASVVCTTLLLWRGWITFSGTRMPPRWLLIPIAILVMSGVYAAYKTFLGRDAGVAMLTLLLTLKLLEMHAKRDLFVVVFLSFFLLLANFFYSQTIGTALMTIIALLALLTAQLSFQYTGEVPPFKQRVGLSIFILALAAPLMLVLFIFFPRIQGPLWGLPSDANSGRTGLSDNMSPGSISQLAQSFEVAFRVKFIDPAPPRAKLYWRGVVLGHYDGRTWTQQPARNWLNTSPAFKPHGASIRHQVTLEPNGHRWLFALELPESPPLIDGNAAVIAPDRTILAAQAVTQRVRYDAVSYVDYALQPDASAAMLQDALRLPIGYNPVTLQFAARLHTRYGDPGQLVDAVLQHFRTEQFRYTLDPPLLGNNAVDEFLFSSRAGFCEHYASAFVVLMRAAGIPARVVTGYQGGEINAVDGFMAVRQSDAHAWAEVWLKNRGWVRVDPTAAVAPNRIEQNLASTRPRRGLSGLDGLDGLVNLAVGKDSFFAKFQVNWEAVVNAWNQRVLNYNTEVQKNFIRSLGFDDVDWRTLTALMVAVGALVLAVIALPLVLNRARREPLIAAYASLCRLMEKQGYARAIAEGPRDYRTRLAAADSTLAPDKKIAVCRFLERYEAIQYGRVPTASKRALISELKSLLSECR